MIRQVIAALFIMAVAQNAAPSCTTDCPGGYLGICVERGKDCKCYCAKDASGVVGRLEEIMEDFGVSPRGVEKGTRLYEESVARGERNFSFELKDRGRTVRITSSSDDQEVDINIDPISPGNGG